MGWFYKDNSHIIKNNCNNFLFCEIHNQTEKHSASVDNYSPNNMVSHPRRVQPLSNTAVRDLNLTDILVIQKSLFISVLEKPCWPHTESKACSSTVYIVLLLHELKYGN